MMDARTLTACSTSSSKPCIMYSAPRATMQQRRVPTSKPVCGRLRCFKPLYARSEGSVETVSKGDSRDDNENEVKESAHTERGPVEEPGAERIGPVEEPDAASLLLSSLAGADNDEEGSEGPNPYLGVAVILGGIALLLGGGYLLKDQIEAFLNFFVDAVDDWGPLGYVAYAGTYTILEVLAIPAIPLTMTAGAIFGPLVGTLIVSFSGTLAATIAFLIARYVARDKIMVFAQRNKKFAAIDRAIGRDSFKFVTLLRLSPLLPLSASNYLYGLTSVKLGPYVLGSFLGMLPGTYAFVGTGHVGKAVLEGGGALGVETWQVACGLGATLLALGFVGQLAKKAIEEVDAEDTAS